MLGIGQRQKRPNSQTNMGRGNDQRDDQRKPWPGRDQSVARVAIENEEQCAKVQRTRRRKVSADSAAAEGDAEQQPVREAALKR